MEDEIKEQIELALTAGKMLAKAISEDSEFATINAKVSKQYYDAFLKEGFTKEEAIQLTSALAGKSNS